MSEVSICNLALGHIGVSKTIASLTEGSEQARQCNRFYPQARDMVLQSAPWPFAEKFEALADLGSPPTEWSYRYAYPSDCLQPWYIVNPANQAQVTGSDSLVWPSWDEYLNWARQKIPFKISGNNDTGKVILTDQEDAVLCYTQAVENTTLFDPLFVASVSRLLAHFISMPLSVSTEISQANYQMYLVHVSEAKAAFKNGMQEKKKPDSEFVTARLGDGRW